MIDDLEIVFPLNSNPIVNKLSKDLACSHRRYQFFCELTVPLRSTLQPEKQESSIVYGRYAQISLDSAYLLYLTQDRKLIQHKMADIRLGIVKAEVIADNLEDFHWHEGFVARLTKSGCLRIKAGQATGPWNDFNALWTNMVKVSDGWLIIGWEKTAFKHIYVKIDQFTALVYTKYIDVHAKEPKKYSKLYLSQTDRWPYPEPCCRRT
jgi:hypothetical protein